MRMLFLLFLLSCSFSIEVVGDLKSDAKWTALYNPYIVKNDITIEDSVVLRIEEGVDLRFDGDFYFLVKGKLIAIGTSEKPVRFLSNNEKPRVGDWKGVKFLGKKAGGILSYCEIRHAQKNLIKECAPLMQHCVFKENQYGLYITYSRGARIQDNLFLKNSYGVFVDYSSPFLERNAISENSYGIYYFFSSKPTLWNNIVTGNTEQDIYMDESVGKSQPRNIDNETSNEPEDSTESKETEKKVDAKKQRQPSFY